MKAKSIVCAYILRTFNRFTLLIFGVLLSLNLQANDKLDFSADTTAAKLLQMPTGKAIQVDNIKVGDSTLKKGITLQRFEVFNKDSVITVQTENQVKTLSQPQTAYFKGSNTDDNGQTNVFLAVDSSGEMRSIIHEHQKIYVNRKLPVGVAGRTVGVTSRKIDKIGDFVNRQFSCGLDHNRHQNYQKIQQLKDISKEVKQLRLRTPVLETTSNTTYVANLAIETDFEYFQLFNNENAASQYIADLIAYISSVYQNEINVALNVSSLRLYSSSNDPWTATGDTVNLLNELQAHYHQNHNQLDRTTVHMISAKRLFGGVAYRGTLCLNGKHDSRFIQQNAFDMGVSTSIQGQFDPNNPQIVWDAVVVAHELGHNFDSEHTHFYDNYDQYSTPIDCCHHDGQGVCASQTLTLPGVGSLSGGTAGNGVGTIMSYCHLHSPGLSNLSMTFGRDHRFGIEASRVNDVTRQFVESQASRYPECFSTTTTTTPPTTSKRVQYDYDGDGKSDILWRHKNQGVNHAFFMDGASVRERGGVNTVGAQWDFSTSGDFNGDGKADVLWRNTTQGINHLFLMDGRSVSSQGRINPVGTAWEIVGTGDYNGDGKSDILWRHSTQGLNHIFFMDGLSVSSQGRVNSVNTAWQVAANGDYNGDGKSDILWRHQTQGSNHIYLMDGLSVSSQGRIQSVGLDWQVAGFGDYDGDGKDDLLWRNQQSGLNHLFFMNGNTLASQASINKVANLDWQIAATGDYNGDGKADILWRHQTQGFNHMYLMNSNTLLSQSSVTRVADVNWQVIK